MTGEAIVGIILCSLVFIGFIVLCIWLSNTVDEKQLKLNQLFEECNNLVENISAAQKHYDELSETNSQLNDAIKTAKADYDKAIERASTDIAAYRKQRTADQDDFFQQRLYDKQQEFSRQFEVEKKEFDRQVDELKKQLQEQKDAISSTIEIAQLEAERQKELYNSLIEPVQAIEKKKDELLYQTIQISDENKADISFLLNETLPRLQHPDILCKLIWTEYFQKPLNQTLQVAGIDENPGIYKITNLTNQKCYIGKSTNVKRRLQEHVKGALGISSISDQEIHRVMAREGIWNFRFERLCTCEKEELGEREKYYISFFNSTDYGYNIASGG